MKFMLTEISVIQIKLCQEELLSYYFYFCIRGPVIGPVFILLASCHVRKKIMF
jgi:hypothetical protein